MIKVTRYCYQEVFRGEPLVRNEPPQRTYDFLERRVERSSREIRSIEAQMDDARRRGASDLTIARLSDAMFEARETYAHACDTRAAFAKVFRPGHGYLDEALWESRIKAREEEERRQARETAGLQPRQPAPLEGADPSQQAAKADAPVIECPVQARDGAPHSDAEARPALKPERASPKAAATEASSHAAFDDPPVRARDIPPEPDAEPGSEPEPEPERASPTAPATEAPFNRNVGEPPDPALEGAPRPGIERRTVPRPARTFPPVPSTDGLEPPRDPATVETWTSLERAPATEHLRRSYKGRGNTPPDEYKFKKGAPSPNPRGRPKGARNLRTVVRELASQTIKVTQNGRRKTVNVIAAAAQLQIQKALKGDGKALLLILPLVKEFWNEEVETKETALSAEERALVQTLSRASRLLDDCDDDSGGRP